MKKRISKRYVLIIVFLLIGFFFTCPFIGRSVDSDYLRLSFDTKNLISYSNAECFYCNPTESGYEIVAFAETGMIKPSNRSGFLFDGMESALRLQVQSQKGMGVDYMPPKEQLDIFPYPQYTDYIGFIIKQDGKVVSSALYKVYTVDDHWTVVFEEVGAWEYPFLNGWITETYVENELREKAALDRIFTFDSAFNRMLSLG